MSWNEETIKSSPVVKKREVFEKHLIEAGLGKEQIESYTLEELEQYLETINILIQNPDAFGVHEAEVNLIGSGIKSRETALPILLARKRLILDRINLLRSQEKILSLKDFINKRIVDKDIQLQLNKELEQLENEAQKLRQQTNKVEESLALEKHKREVEKDKTELLERRSKVLLSFIERESAATITGVILIVIITLAQVFALFVKIPPSDILNNAFLLILGYFFGQTTNKASRGKE